VTVSRLETAIESRLLALRKQLHQSLIGAIDFAAADRLGREQFIRDCRARAEQLMQREGHGLSAADQGWVVQGVIDDMFGLGPLEPLLADPTVSDVLVVRHDHVFVEREGRLQPAVVHFRDTVHLMNVIQRIVRNAGRRIDERSPMVDARLPDGSRVNAIIPPLAIDGPQLSIRRFPEKALDLPRLVELGSIAPATAELIRGAVAGRVNIIFSGGAGVGKTTMLNAASEHLAPSERVITIEDAAELRLRGDHVVRLETRAANVEGVGEITPRDLVRNALRMRPDRIIVGECRGAEAFDMMQAMNTGHEGSMSTLHANSARDTLIRLETMLSMGGYDMPVRVLREYVASAIQMVVHMVRLPDGRRVVGEVIEVCGTDDSGVRLRTLHQFQLQSFQGGRAIGQFEATGETPDFAARLAARGHHLDPTLFRRGVLAAGPAT
jgi:pilus assembly protein CpaF